MTIFKKKKIGRTLGTRGRYRPSSQKTKRRNPKKKLQKNSEKKILRKKSRSRNSKTVIRVIIILITGLLLYLAAHFLFISDTFKIEKIDYEREAVGVEDENPILNYVKNFEGSNILLFKTEKEELYLREHYPEYKTINIKKSFPNTLIVEMEAYGAEANLIIEKEGYAKKFIISKNGVISDSDTEDPALPYIYLETPETLTVGEKAITEENLAFITEAIRDFEDKFGMQILDVTYYQTARELHLRTERYFNVWLDTRETVDTQLNKLKQALPQLNIYEDELEYIDLRISGQSGDKVIYK